MLEFSSIECRVLGALMEKEVTTPEQYPLSLNALTNACNQKSNRDPVMSLDEQSVQDTLDALDKKGVVSCVSFGSRVAKYRHRFCNTEFSAYHFSKKEFAVLCCLFLRGAQTPGELRTRTNRLCQFSDVTEVESTLDRLAEREEGTFVRKLPREPGKRESRYLHLFSPAADIAQSQSASLNAPEPRNVETAMSQSDSSSSTNQLERISTLENELANLREEFNALKSEWDNFNS